MNNDTIGVDVSKAHLDAHRLADEPTGPYHRALERALGAAGVPFVKVNPRQARDVERRIRAVGFR
jgi:transposase